MSKKFKTQHEHDAYVAEKKKNKTIWGVIMASLWGRSSNGTISIFSGVWR